MGMFVISKRYNEEYKFVFTSRKGKTIFTSISCKDKTGCYELIAAMRDSITLFTFTKNSTPAGKHFFRISKDGLVLATSRKYATPLSLQKGIDEVIKYLPPAETLDFSENDFVFPDAEEVFGAAGDV
ncbi:DUF1508 domain-containing protein [Flavobacterium sp. RHBU_24]|uniref:DUF1508 domain-containing protein n=1 Tax=Flavobacterium sp. RHBU_24 TaxID=3391185 RepID=UPI0039855218